MSQARTRGTARHGDLKDPARRPESSDAGFDDALRSRAHSLLMSPAARLRTALVLTSLLVLTGVFNVLPWTHPDGEERKSEVAYHLSNRAEWFRRHSSDDLVFLAETHGRTTRHRAAPYLWIRRYFADSRLITYPRSVIDPTGFLGRPLRRQPEGQPPIKVLSRPRMLGLATIDLAVCRYDPVITPEVADRLLARADYRSKWETGHEYAIVDSQSGFPPRARLVVSEKKLFFVADEALTAVGAEPEEPDC